MRSATTHTHTLITTALACAAGLWLAAPALAQGSCPAPTPPRAGASGAHAATGHALIGREGKLVGYRTAVRRSFSTGRTSHASQSATCRTRTPRRGCPARCSRCANTRPAPTPRPSADEPLAPRLLAALRAGDLAAACRLARWTAGSPARERILRQAVFTQLPSPTLLSDAARRLRDEEEWRRHSGRDSLLRVLAGPLAKTA